MWSRVTPENRRTRKNLVPLLSRSSMERLKQCRRVGHPPTLAMPLEIKLDDALSHLFAAQVFAILNSLKCLLRRDD